MNNKDALFVSIVMAIQCIAIFWNTYQIGMLQDRVLYIEARHAKHVQKTNP